MAGMEKPRGFFVDWWFRTLLAGARRSRRPAADAMPVARLARDTWFVSSGAAMMQSRRANARVRSAHCDEGEKRETHLPTTFRNRHFKFWALGAKSNFTVCDSRISSISFPPGLGGRKGGESWWWCLQLLRRKNFFWRATLAGGNFSLKDSRVRASVVL